MRLFYAYGATMYGGGMAVVAANTNKQARKTLLDSDEYGFKDPQYGLEITSVVSIRGASIERKTPGVIVSFAYIE